MQTRILVADDNAEIREILRILLTEYSMVAEPPNP